MNREFPDWIVLPFLALPLPFPCPSLTVTTAFGPASSIAWGAKPGSMTASELVQLSRHPSTDQAALLPWVESSSLPVSLSAPWLPIVCYTSLPMQAVCMSTSLDCQSVGTNEC